MWSHQAPDEACPQTAFTLSLVDGASTQRCFQAQMSASLGLKINQQFDTQQPTGGRSFAAWLLHKVYLHPPTADLQTPAEGLKYRGIEARAPSVHSAPDAMAPSFPDVCLKENMTLADRLYNLQLIQEFCKDNLSSCCHFTLEDMLYASSTIKVPGETQPLSSVLKRLKFKSL